MTESVTGPWSLKSISDKACLNWVQLLEPFCANLSSIHLLFQVEKIQALLSENPAESMLRSIVFACAEGEILQFSPDDTLIQVLERYNVRIHNISFEYWHIHWDICSIVLQMYSNWIFLIGKFFKREAWSHYSIGPMCLIYCCCFLLWFLNAEFVRD